MKQVTLTLDEIKGMIMSMALARLQAEGRTIDQVPGPELLKMTDDAAADVALAMRVAMESK